MKRARFASLSAFIRARLSADGYLGLHLTVGALIMIVASFLFGNLAEDVMTADEITMVDAQVSEWFHAHATPQFTQFMLFVSHLHSTLGILVFSSLFAVHLIRQKAWDWLLTLAVAVPGGMLLNFLLKHAFQRARPSFADPLLTLPSYSFPSGHTAGTTLFYGVLAAYLLRIVEPWRWRVFICLLAVALVSLVGLSRIYLGVHYLSDVLAAVAASSCWLALSLTALATWHRRQMTQQ